MRWNKQLDRDISRLQWLILALGVLLSIAMLCNVAIGILEMW